MLVVKITLRSLIRGEGFQFGPLRYGLCLLGGELSSRPAVPELDLLVLVPRFPLYGLLLFLNGVILSVHAVLRLQGTFELRGVLSI